ncbi:MAG: YjbQ family protein [Bacteroidetes bacterium]|jgi:secondary thiamine-phosphate synthase enzyme|nr:YjbQ family protein [Bacteroidota bacterium]
MVEQTEFSLPGHARGFHLITHDVVRKLPDLPQKGLLHLHIKHTSAGLTLNENADPTVRSDFNKFVDKLVPENEPYFDHTLEGGDDMPAHIKSSLIGSSVTIPITNGRLNLGTWQGIYLGEFRNRGGSRNFVATIYS